MWTLRHCCRCTSSLYCSRLTAWHEKTPDYVPATTRIVVPCTDIIESKLLESWYQPELASSVFKL